ncbi:MULTISPECIES: hypothetical protein [Burkholderia cepacia complex]|uniref:hypothetical protein n=1 Tax=Burkholderia cepacia complex TaxID=87882 RepID=UPI00158B113B|nr:MULTISPECIES: hypothetical protein [Burkholderia cepacia complex]
MKALTAEGTGAHRYFLLRSILEMRAVDEKEELNFAGILLRVEARRSLAALGGMAGEW